MVPRPFLLAVLCSLMLLAPWGMNAGAAARPNGKEIFRPTIQLSAVQFVGLQRSARAPNLVADDGPTYSFSGLQPLEVLTDSAFSLPVAIHSAYCTENDRLNLTQRRRE